MRSESDRGSRPLLLLDIDGVLFPSAERCPARFQPCRTPNWPEDGTSSVTWMCPDHGVWLRGLGERFELVCASAWGFAANGIVGPLLGLEPLPFVPFPTIPFAPALKVPAIAEYVGHRAVAWVDDLLTTEAWQWASERSAPTKLVDVDAAVGLTQVHVSELLVWAHGLSDAGSRRAVELGAAPDDPAPSR